MSKRKPLRVLVATDGSPAARAAISTTLSFPWPDHVDVSALVAGRIMTKRGASPSEPMAGPELPARVVAERAGRALAHRWPDAPVHTRPGSAVDAILAEAERAGTDVIVMGWRGQGAVGRLLCGSVSRGVVRGAGCAVLVVRRAAHDVRRVVLGFDGSAHARRAVALVARLGAPRGGRVTLLSAAASVPDTPSHVLAPRALRAEVAARRREIVTEQLERARRTLERPARTLEAAGWKVDREVTTGAPLDDLLAAVRAEHARLLVVGARGRSPLEKLMVGSVAEGALDRSPVPILITR